MTPKTQRDVFWERIYELAVLDHRIHLVIADMGAPALDIFRSRLSSRYIDVGIAEQQGAAVSAGLALDGQKAFLYAIAPFVSLRCYEHTRVNLAGMNLPVTLVGVGAGFSYEDSGPTHHAVDDLSVLRILPHMRVNTISDTVMARAFADLSVNSDAPNYVRLDRQPLSVIYAEGTDFSAGLQVHGGNSDVLLIAMGNMVHVALAAAKRLETSRPVTVIDLHTLPICKEQLLDIASPAKHLVTLEEHNLAGGLGSAVCELLADAGLNKPVKRLGLDFTRGYYYTYGGREALQKRGGIDLDSVVQTLKSLP